MEETGIPNPSSETMSNITISSELREQVRQAREAYLQLANLGTESKNQVTRITRLARGLPAGGDLDYVDDVTLSEAFSGRQPF